MLPGTIFSPGNMSSDDRRAAGGGSGLTGIYREYIGDPEDRTTVYGCWLYVVAGVLGLLAIVTVVAGAELLPGRQFLVREVAIAAGGIAAVLLLFGIVLQTPIRRGGQLLAGLGVAAALMGVWLFLEAYPRNWAGGPADRTSVVLLVYGAGLAVLVGVVAFAPLVTSKRSLLLDSGGGEPGPIVAEGTVDDAGSTADAGSTVDGEPSADAEPAATGSAAGVDRSPEPDVEPAMRTAAESLFLGDAGEGTLFAVYEEASDGWDWRLVYQPVVAESDRTYDALEDV